MLKKVNLKEEADSIRELYTYRQVGQLNDHMLNVVQVEDRTLDFHVHESSDEMFYVIEGTFAVELDDGLVELTPGDFLIVPAGVRHRPVCTGLVKCLLVERAGTLTRENSGGTYGG